MRKVLVIAAVLISLLSVSLEGSAVKGLHVSLDGRDSWPGTQTQPFRTLEKARDAVRSLKKTGDLPKGGITVWVHGGTYELARPFELAASDSGSKDSPIVYRAWACDTAVISGGKAITNFELVRDPDTLARLHDSSHGYVWKADLKKLGISDFGHPVAAGKRPELFFNERRMILARWPSVKYEKITDVTYEKPIEIFSLKGDAIGKFIYTDDRPKRWAKEKDGYMHGYWFFDWSEEYEKIESIDTAARIVSLAPPYHFYGYRKGQRYYALNMMIELDYPNEWFLDRDTGILYFWPPSSTKEGKAYLSILPSLVDMKGVENVTLRDLTFEGCRGDALQMAGCSDVKIAGCTIRNVGAWAATVSGGRSCGVIGCDIYGLGGGGVNLSGGDRKTLTPAGHYAVNNVIHDFSVLKRTYTPAISLSGVGQRAANNLLYDAPHNALMFVGNDHVIEYNEVHNVCYETNDVGAFYTGRDWTGRGTVVRYNYFHDIHSGPDMEFHDCSAIYLDDMNCGTIIYGNIFFRTSRGVLIGGGRDNIVDNNIFVKCSPFALNIDDRGIEAMTDMVVEGGWLRNILDQTPYKTPPWSERYPELVNILEDDPGYPKGNIIRRNINWDGKWLNIYDRAKPLVKFEDNLIYTDPGFVDANNYDFSLKSDSPAYKIGFKPIPFEKIGPHKDEYRKSVPPVRYPAQSSPVWK